MTSLTSRQSDTLAFISKFQAEKGFGPTYREIADGIGLASKSGVHRMLIGLEERGAIRRLADRSRSVEVIRKIGPESEALLKAIIAEAKLWGHVHLESPSMVEAMRFLARRQQ